MKELVTIKHAQMTAQQIARRVLNQSSPVRRSTHVGNQNGRELVMQCLMPPGIDIMAVDTIQAGDRYSQPRTIRLAEGVIPLASNKAASLIVGAAVVREDIDKHIPASSLLGCVPTAGESIQDLHMRSIAALNPTNMPVVMSQFFARHAGLYIGIMHAAEAAGQISRAANQSGKIESVSAPSIAELGIFGLHGTSPPAAGVLPSLDAMMAMDMLISMNQGSDVTLHLAGADMTRYTRDPERMAAVAQLVEAGAVEIGLTPTQHTYEVTDVTGLGSLVDQTDFTSQHELLRVLSTEQSRPLERILG